MVKIGFGSFGDSFSVCSLKSYLAEFIATLLFVFAGVGSAIAYGKKECSQAQCIVKRGYNKPPPYTKFLHKSVAYKLFFAEKDARIHSYYVHVYIQI